MGLIKFIESIQDKLDNVKDKLEDWQDKVEDATDAFRDKIDSYSEKIESFGDKLNSLGKKESPSRKKRDSREEPSKPKLDKQAELRDRQIGRKEEARSKSEESAELDPLALAGFLDTEEGGKYLADNFGSDMAELLQATLRGEEYEVPKRPSSYGYTGSVSTIEHDWAEPMPSLKRSLDEWGEDTLSVAMTRFGEVIAFDKNGSIMCQGLGKEYSAVYDALTQIADSSNEKLLHAVLAGTHSCLIYKQNGGTNWCGTLPDRARRNLTQCIEDGEQIRSFSMAVNGDYVLLTNRNMYSNSMDGRASKLLQTAVEEYGNPEFAAITNKGFVVLCEEGVFFDNVPQVVGDAITNVMERSHRLSRIFFTDYGNYVIICEDGTIAYRV